MKYKYKMYEELVLTERFDNGNFLYSKTGPTFNTGARSQLLLVPTLYYTHAETLAAKPCTVDDQLNLTAYLQEKFGSLLNIYAGNNALEPGKYRLVFQVGKTGKPSVVRLENPSGKEKDRILIGFVQSVNYWIPSQKDGKTISDTFTLDVEFIRGSDGNLFSSLPVITREKGN